MENENPLPPPPSAPPPPQEPPLKKQKMSTTSEEDEHPSIPRPVKYKRRKIALIFAYCGVGYQGMQKNPGAKTIEGDLEEALFHSGAVPEQDRGCPQRYDWARSARTDKGVSAVGQVVSGRFYIDPPGLVDRLNDILPDQFRIFGYKRVTASFSAKKFCDKRRYVYLIPVFALDPCAHRDRESVLASLGSGNELAKCLECSERGRKVAGLMGKRSFDSRGNVDNTGNSTVSNAVVAEGSFVDQTNVDLSADRSKDGSFVDTLVSESLEEKAHEKEISGEKEDEIIMDKREFSYGEKEKERFNRILGHYVGTHNFHNFTTRTKAEDPSARRYILSFEANSTVTIDGLEFVKCEVVGQSFMLHQIRKLIGVAVAIMRNVAPESLIQTALRKDININVPTAPEVGLYLDECFFTSYNRKWKDTHEEVSMKAYAEEAEDFKMKHIYSHIASMEHKEGSVGLWLHSLNYRNYPDLLVSDNKVNSDGRSHEVENKLEAVLAEDIVSSDGRPLEEENKREAILVDDIVSSDGKPVELEIEHKPVLADDGIVDSDGKPLEVENNHSVVAEDTVKSDGKALEVENKHESIAP